MASNTGKIEMCSGPLFKNIIRFTVPFMLTAFLQHLYNAADVIVVGRYAGEEALAGVGTTSSLTTLILNMFLGLSVGVSVSLGRALGANNNDDIHRIVHTAIPLSVISGAVVSFIGVVFAEPLLGLIDVPDNVMPQAKIYMQIIFAGQIPSLIYNFGAAILRAKGDTKRPLYIVTATGFVNVLLNLWFVVGFGMQADGVALATTISQIISAVAILVILCHQEDSTRLFLNKLRIRRRQLAEIFRIGIPSGFQGIIFSLSNVLIQSSVNSFNSSAAMAGSAAASNVGSFYYVAINSFYQASVTFISQNFGANNLKRIPKIIYCCFIGVSFVWVIEILVTLFAGEFLVGIYAPGNAEAVIMGVKRLMIIGCTYGICGLMEVMSGALRGIGYSFTSMVSSVAGVCGVRIIWIFTVFRAFKSFETLYSCYPVSWLITLALHSALFVIAFNRIKRSEELGVRS